MVTLMVKILRTCRIVLATKVQVSRKTEEPNFLAENDC